MNSINLTLNWLAYRSCQSDFISLRLLVLMLMLPLLLEIDSKSLFNLRLRIEYIAWLSVFMKNSMTWTPSILNISEYYPSKCESNKPTPLIEYLSIITQSLKLMKKAFLNYFDWTNTFQWFWTFNYFNANRYSFGLIIKLQIHILCQLIRLILTNLKRNCIMTLSHKSRATLPFINFTPFHS